MAPLASLSNLKRPDLFQQKGFIAESWVDSVSGSTFNVANPATLETIATLPKMNAIDTEKAVTAAHEAFKSYKKNIGAPASSLAAAMACSLYGASRGPSSHLDA